VRPQVPLGWYYTHMGDTPGKPDRSHWPVRKFPMGTEPGDDLSATTTAEERIKMVWQLTLEAWSLAGLPLPTYTRGETPVRVIPLSADQDETEP
jgi:hypothetical protein